MYHASHDVYGVHSPTRAHPSYMMYGQPLGTAAGGMQLGEYPTSAAAALQRPNSPAPTGIVALSPTHDLPVAKADVVARRAVSTTPTPIGSPLSPWMISSPPSGAGSQAPMPVGMPGTQQRFAPPSHASSVSSFSASFHNPSHTAAQRGPSQTLHHPGSTPSAASLDTHSPSAGIFDFDPLEDGWLASPAPLLPSPRSFSSSHSPSPHMALPRNDLPHLRSDMPSMSSSFPDNFFRSVPSVQYSGAVWPLPSSPVANFQPEIMVSSFQSMSSSHHRVMPPQPSSVPHSRSPLAQRPMDQLIPPTSDLLLRRRAVSVGASSTSLTGQTALPGPQVGALPIASTAAGGAISTKHSSRVIAVVNMDALQEAGVDLQLLFDTFQQYGPVRSLDPVSATADLNPSSQTPLNVLLLPHSRMGSVPGSSNCLALISFFDLRHAQKAMMGLNGKCIATGNSSILGGEPVPLHLQYFVLRDFPGGQPQTSTGASNTFNQHQNQGTLVIFNLDPAVSNEELRDIFAHFGEIKEIRESPNKKHKFVEFFDVRCAEKAMRTLNKTDIKGRKIKIEPSRPGGSQSRKAQPISAPVLAGSQALSFGALIPADSVGAAEGDVSATDNSTALIQSLSDLVLLHQQSAVADHHIQEPYASGPVLGSSPLLLSSHHYPHLDLSSSRELAPSASGGESTSDRDDTDNDVSTSIPALRLSLTTLDEDDGKSNAHVHVRVPPPRPLVVTRRSQRSSSMPPKMATSSSFVSIQTPIAPSAISTALAPSVPLFGDAESPKGRKRASSQSTPRDAVDQSSQSPAVVTMSSGNSVGSTPASSPVNSARGQGPRSLLSPTPSSSSLRPRHSRTTKLTGINRRERSSSEGSQRLAAHKSGISTEEEKSGSKSLFELDLLRVRRGEDRRTTLMVKNIPNKYDQEMLLLAINRQHAGLYDFFYLPIDFKNKCNVGYAFINFIEPTSICSFFEEFNNKKWERFNSEKVCQISYARIQGKTAMVEHFKNSSLMFEDPKCRPLLFFSDGELAGTAEPFPVSCGRPRPRRDSSTSSESSSVDVNDESKLLLSS